MDNMLLINNPTQNFFENKHVLSYKNLNTMSLAHYLSLLLVTLHFCLHCMG